MAIIQTNSLDLPVIQAIVDDVNTHDGDTIQLPQGISPPWNDLLNITGKNLHITGNSMFGTTITGPGRIIYDTVGGVVTPFSAGHFSVTAIPSDHTARLSHFTINLSLQVYFNSTAILFGGLSTVHLSTGVVCGGFRLDHVRWTTSDPNIEKKSYILKTAGYLSGSIDHNFIDYSTAANGGEIMSISRPGTPTSASSTYGEYDWAQDYVFGGGLLQNGEHDAIYIEDNIFHRSGVIVDSLVGGGSLVCRYNTTWGGLSVHGIESGNNMGPRAVEHYHNVIIGDRHIIGSTIQTPTYVGHGIRGGATVMFNERFTNYTERSPFRIESFRLSASGSGVMGLADGTNFFDLNERGTISYNGYTFVPIITNADTRIGSVYAQSSGTPPSCVRTSPTQFTLYGLDGGNTANKWAGFTLRNMSVLPPEGDGSQGVLSQAANLGYTIIKTSTTGMNTVVTLGAAANAGTVTNGVSGFNLTDADQWEIRRVKIPFTAPGSGKMDTPLNGGNNKNRVPLAFIDGTKRWCNQVGDGVWQKYNKSRSDSGSSWTDVSPFPATDPVITLTPGGAHDGALPPGYPIRAATADSLRIGADWEAPGFTEAIQSTDPSPGAAATVAPGGIYPNPLVTGEAPPSASPVLYLFKH